MFKREHVFSRMKKECTSPKYKKTSPEWKKEETNKQDTCSRGEHGLEDQAEVHYLDIKV